MKTMLLSLICFSSLGFAQSVQPGLWRADTSFEVNGITLPASNEEQCIDAIDAKDVKITILKELEQQGCTSTKWVSKGQKIEVSLKCSKSGLNAEGSLKGLVTDKSYALNGDAEGTYQSIPSEATIALKGKWLSSCTK